MEPNAPLQQTPPIPQTTPNPRSVPKPPIQTILIIIILILIGSSVYLGYQNMQLQKQIKQMQNIPTPTPTETPFPSRPQPVISGWKLYTDLSNGDFSFEYPNFMPDPTIYWPNENPVRYISIYTWQIDKMSSGNYDHNIDLRITGPYKESTSTDLISWIKDQNWPYQEGELQEMAGKSKITYKILQGRQVVQSVFTENETKNARSWVLYLKAKSGIYRIDLNTQGSDEEISKYQTIFDHILSTFKFLN